MFFLRMITRSFTRQLRRRLLIALTVCLSATVSVSMLGVVFDVGDTVTARDNLTGITVNATISKKIVKVSDGVLSVDYGAE